MEDEYAALCGVEDDDFESQFASELEVLAELEDDKPATSLPKKSQLREQQSFDDAIASGDAVRCSTVVSHKAQSRTNGKAMPEPTDNEVGVYGRKREADAMLQNSEDDFNITESLIDLEPSLRTILYISSYLQPAHCWFPWRPAENNGQPERGVGFRLNSDGG